MNLPGMNLNMSGMNNAMQNQNFGNPLMQQQPQQQHIPQQQLQQRPGMPRAATIQQMNSIPGQAPMGKVGQFNGIASGPNSAPIPGTGNNSAVPSRGNTPQMGNQPQPPLPGQFPPQFRQQPVPQVQPGQNGTGMHHNVTPIVPQQQQPTPQSQPRPGIPQALKQTIPIQGQMPMSASGQLQSPLQKQMNSPQFFRTQEQEQLQNEMNTKIFKRNLGNAGVIRVLNLIDQISNEAYENLSNIEYWKKVIQIYCMNTCIMRLTTKPTKATPTNSKTSNNFSLDSDMPGASQQFELNTSTAAGFFAAQVLYGGVSQMSVSLPGLKFQVMNNSSIFIISRLSIQFQYADGSIGNVSGAFKMLMNREFRIEWIDCQCLNYESSISFGCLEKQWTDFSKASKTDTDASTKSHQEFISHLYQSSNATKASNTSGIHEDALRVLQVGDTMSHLRALMGFSQQNNISSPMKALDMFMAANNQTGGTQKKRNSVDTNNLNGQTPSPNSNP